MKVNGGFVNVKKDFRLLQLEQDFDIIVELEGLVA